MEKKVNTSFTISIEAHRLLRLLAIHLGLNKTSVIEYLIREKARQERVQ